MFINKHFFKISLISLGFVAAACFIFLCVIALFEFKPADVEKISIYGTSSSEIKKGQILKVMTWNIGYGALDDSADFFMDGGTHVTTATEKSVWKNIRSIGNEIEKENADIIFVQEIDAASSRSYSIDELSYYRRKFTDYESSFGVNFKCLFVPYPFPPVGKVHSGIATFVKGHIADAERISLPVPFKFPVSIFNLKRCIVVNRIPLQGDSKEIVAVNVHLEAYDSGEGKKAQTEKLRKILTDEYNKGNYVIAAGDFNQVFSNADLSNVPVLNDKYWKPGQIDVEEFKGFSFLSDGNVPSCRSLDRPYAGSGGRGFQFYLIDGFIVSDNMNVKSVKTLDKAFRNADHNPVVMEIEIL